MLLYKFYDRRLIAIERWPRSAVVCASLVAVAVSGTLAWIYRASIADGSADRIVTLVVAGGVIAVAVPLRWLMARPVGGTRS